MTLILMNKTKSKTTFIFIILNYDQKQNAIYW